MRFRAPGKAFLAGEYAVLEGATAIIAAIARHAIADTSAEPSDRPEVAAVARALSARIGPAQRLPGVDTSALYAGHRKLGLGSSAAALVASAGALLAESRQDLSAPELRALLAPTLIEAHRTAQGGVGSGGDVAASLHGGIIRYRMGPPPLVERFDVGPLEIVLVDSGEPVRTGPLVRAAARAGVPRLLHDAAAAIEAALLGSDREALSEAVDLHICGMALLGPTVDRPLVTEPFCRVLAVAKAHGACAKPSGAGGGDLVVAFAPDRGAADDLVAALARLGFWAERATVDSLGVREVLP